MTREERLAQDGAADPVLFYRPEDEWGIFSNFSLHAIWMPQPFTCENVRYQTSEHRYRPGQSKFRGGPRGIKLRDDWGDEYGHLCSDVMIQAVIAKATQHTEMRKALRATGDRHIYEDSPVDDIWGWRYRNDYRGKNLLGRALMIARIRIDSPGFDIQ